MQTFISVLNGLLPVVASTKFAVYLNSCISYISYLYLVFLAKLYTGKIFQIHIHLYCNICKFITFILQLRHPRCVLTLPTFICLLFTAHYILTTQDQITPRPTTAFGSTYATHSLSHRRLTALVTPYLRDHCWEHRGWNLTLVESTWSLPDHCGFCILQYTYATRRCTHAYPATFYPALLYEILSTQQSSKLSPYHKPRDRSTPGTSDNLIGLTPTPLYHVLL